MSKGCDILNRFLEEIHQQKCLFKVSEEVVNDLQLAVEELVKKYVRKVSNATAYPLFSGSKILSRGSFYEGTKVEKPNEFDFVVELDVLSQPGSVEFSSECPDCPGYTHVVFTDPKLKEVYTKLDSSPEGNLLRPHIISRYYQDSLAEAYWKIFPGCSLENMRIDKGCGFVRQHEHIRSSWGPNTLLKLVWTTTTLPEEDISKCVALTVDITPAIVYRPPQGSAVGAGADRQYHVVPGRNEDCKHGSSFNCCCWRISHSSEETEKMRNLNNVHKKIYMIFKVVFRRRIIHGCLRSLTSYMLKTGVLHHSDKCDGKGSAGACAMKILEALLACAEQGQLPDYFVPEKNVWARNHERKVVSPVPILQKLIAEFKSIAGCAVEDYDFEYLFKYFYMLMEEFAIIEDTELFVHYVTMPELDESSTCATSDQ